jgi:hypothetical protein
MGRLSQKLIDTKMFGTSYTGGNPMKAQQPAQGIMLYKDWGTSKMYSVMCNCGSNECQHTVDVEADECEIVVTTYTTQKSKWWSMNRFQIIWTLLTKGYIEYQASIHMDRQQALNYAETLKSAIKDVEVFRDAKTTKSAST